MSNKPSNKQYALVGFANAGKSTLFNQLTGAKQSTGNFSGVTVAKKQSIVEIGDHQATLSDLPGVSTLMANAGKSQDVVETTSFLKENSIDCLINVVDATQLSRQLSLTTELLCLDIPMMVVLTKTDRAASANVDEVKLAKLLGCPVVSVNALRLSAKATLFDVLSSDITKPEINNLPSLLIHPASLIEKPIPATIEERQARFSFVESVINQVVDDSVINDKAMWFDKWALHPVLGMPVFLFMMYLLFMFSINVGSAFIDFFDIMAGTLFVDYPTQWLTQFNVPQFALTFIEGIGMGIQTVATFIPVVAALFIGLSILETSGYLARAAFVVDSFMQKIGLPGKAFVPLIVGFGCNVPAIMSARILDSERERITTIMMAPFMSCGARLPVYALFAAAFFPESGQNIVFLLYVVGILAAVATGFLLKYTVLNSTASVQFTELPAYQLPSLRYVANRVWQRTRSFVFGAGKTIVLVVCLLNFFNSVGTDGSFGHQETQTSILSVSAQAITPLLSPMGIKEDNWEAGVGIITGIFAKEALVATLDNLYSKGLAQESGEISFVARWQEAIASIGDNMSGIEVKDPLGTDIGDVSSMDIAAQEQGVDRTTFTVMQEKFDGQLGAFAYLLFILLYTPCAAALGAIKSETDVKWALFSATWCFAIAYLSATAVYQAGQLFASTFTAISLLTIVVALFVAIYYWLKGVGKRILTIPVKVVS